MMNDMRDLINIVESVEPGVNGYVALRLDPEIQKTVINALEQSGIEDVNQDMHCTVFFCNRGMEKLNLNTEKVIEVHFEPKINRTDISELGEALVIKFSSPEIQEIFDSIKDKGYQHSFETLIPHMSLKYEPSKEDIEKIKDVISDLNIESLKFSDIYQEDIDPDF